MVYSCHWLQVVVVNAGMWRHGLSVRKLERLGASSKIDHSHYREKGVEVGMQEREDFNGILRLFVAVIVSRMPERAWQGGPGFQGQRC